MSGTSDKGSCSRQSKAEDRRCGSASAWAAQAWPEGQPAGAGWGDEERDPVCTWEFAEHAQLLDRQQRAAHRRR